MTMILDDIYTALKTVDEYVFYGAVPKKAMDGQPWNYIIYGRASSAASDGRTSRTTYFDVHIIRENYVPDETTRAVIEKMVALPGVRIAPQDSTYSHDYKTGTDTVIEAQIIHFTRSEKGH